MELLAFVGGRDPLKNISPSETRIFVNSFTQKQIAIAIEREEAVGHVEAVFRGNYRIKARRVSLQ